MRTWTVTTVGRDGPPSVRKSRTGASCRQKPQPIDSAGDSTRAGGSGGASQRGHESDPAASFVERDSRRSSWLAEPRDAGSSGSDPFAGRCRLTRSV